MCLLPTPFSLSCARRWVPPLASGCPSATSLNHRTRNKIYLASEFPSLSFPSHLLYPKFPLKLQRLSGAIAASLQLSLLRISVAAAPSPLTCPGHQKLQQEISPSTLHTVPSVPAPPSELSATSLPLLSACCSSTTALGPIHSSVSALECPCSWPL